MYEIQYCCAYGSKSETKSNNGKSKKKLTKQNESKRMKEKKESNKVTNVETEAHSR